MTEVVRLILVAHAMTEAVAAGRFPVDEPLSAAGRRQIDPAAVLPAADFAVCAPETRTRQTAELLGLRAEVDDRLADLDYGRWRGETLGSVPPAELTIWLTRPDRAPHGGESVAGLVGRVRDWLAATSSRPGRVVAVTHPAVIRAAVVAALDAPSKSFWRVDVAPAGRTVLHFRGQAWTLRTGFAQR